ncbi:YqeG family HAD IIIA-type phosphatase [Fervidobacterium nodosum]|uniref:Hydrolase, HAD-superfamily, subfamily IIIA n=1 Tax=Fervidobacterium nodosum (strain ATCC 35602 / DSM 5306 / Rt17-B1) TaxID=381764 RepID=A7HJL5_FERNB|nr:HAD hydrolase-like protein [Fervidobacterium nodosum]ABS60098.1 hydrolase, HAD-superfamily, subfamily IIIA [Fervidobacterium nodosum Rt17-B1]
MKVKSVKDIDFKKLLSEGKRVFLFDFDNTINVWKSNIVPKEIEEIFKYLLSNDASVFIVSNGKKRKLEINNVKIIWRALKPLPFKVMMRLKKHFKNKDEIVVIGDQIFTDILFGKLIGAYTIKVEPLDTSKEFITTKIFRFFERLFKLH